MAQLAVNKDGTEVIGESLCRGYINRHVFVAHDYGVDNNKLDVWLSIYNDPDEGYTDISIQLPKGTIKKLIGRELTWNDKPVEF